MEEIKITHRFVDVSEPTQLDINILVQKNLDQKMSSYLKHFTDNKPDVEIVLHYDIEKNKKDWYDGSFHLTIDGKAYDYRRDDFVNPMDLVNHAFDHFKLQLSDIL